MLCTRDFLSELGFPLRRFTLAGLDYPGSAALGPYGQAVFVSSGIIIKFTCFASLGSVL